jgi:ubiquinone/menaquinone biosynthesis C-methylase UbiE
MSSSDARFVGNIPEHYDQGLGPLIFVDYAAEMARRVAAGNPKRLLETAAGTGMVTRRLRDALPAGSRITATDLNPPMLDIARTKFQRGEAVEFQQADATALPFGDASFDAAVCQFGAMFFPDKDRACREVHRVLVSGGRYFFSVWDSHRHNAYGRVTHRFMESLFPAGPPSFMAAPFSYPFEPIKDSLTDAGFTAISADVVRLEKTVPDVAAFAHAIIFGGPLADQIQARGEDPTEIAAALAPELRRAFGGDPGRMSIQAIFISAQKPV